MPTVRGNAARYNAKGIITGHDDYRISRFSGEVHVQIGRSSWAFSEADWESIIANTIRSPLQPVHRVLE